MSPTLAKLINITNISQNNDDLCVYMCVALQCVIFFVFYYNYCCEEHQGATYFLHSTFLTEFQDFNQVRIKPEQCAQLLPFLRSSYITDS